VVSGHGVMVSGHDVIVSEHDVINSLPEELLVYAVVSHDKLCFFQTVPKCISDNNY